ncbi:MAG: DUF2177 family protein [Erysipelotrichia bacterium]|jgi:uncharacterized membrane protein|nr:DUF2177 family protein [Erysipelotrichia bacterium]
MFVTFLVAFAVFMVIDLIWLGVIAAPFYRNQIGFLMAKNVNWAAAVLFYIIFIVGMVVFVIQPALTAQSITSAILLGALFGLVTYATYDLTNLATLEGWPLTLVVVDIIWGTTLSVLVSTITYILMNAFF